MFESSILLNKVSEAKESQDGGWSWKKATHNIQLLFILSGIASVAWGVWKYYSPEMVSSQESSVLFDLSADLPDQLLYVDISGAVQRPGIYPVAEGERLANVIEAAGGISSLADTNYLHSTLNLSARLKDEQKIYIPFEGDSKVVGSTLNGNSTNNSDYQLTSNSLISINEATAAELDTLPRVGAVTVQKIIDGRPYTTIEELVTKKVISQALLTEIQSFVKL